MAKYGSLPSVCGLAALVVALGACGSIQDGLVAGTSRFVSEEYHFEISLSDSLDEQGWFIINEEDAALAHQYTPPDSSQWFPVATVIPPSVSFPALAPLNMDVFQLRTATHSAKALVDLRVEQVSADSSLISRQTLVVNGEEAEEVVFRQNTQVVVETYMTRSGMGYCIHALGSLPSEVRPRPFRIDPGVYNYVVGSFRFTN